MTTSRETYTTRAILEGENELLSKVHDLSQRLNLLNLQSIESHPEGSGFLISSYDPARLRDFLSERALLLAALGRSDRFLAYLLATPGNSFYSRHTTIQISWSGSQFAEKAARLFGAGEFWYLDQLGIEPEYRGKGVAAGLLRRARERIPQQPLMIAAILKKP